MGAVELRCLLDEGELIKERADLRLRHERFGLHVLLSGVVDDAPIPHLVVVTGRNALEAVEVEIGVLERQENRRDKRCFSVVFDRSIVAHSFMQALCCCTNIVELNLCARALPEDLNGVVLADLLLGEHLEVVEVVKVLDKARGQVGHGNLMVDFATADAHGEDTLVERDAVGEHRLRVVDRTIERVVSTVGMLGDRVTIDEVARALHVLLVLNHDDETT